MELSGINFFLKDIKLRENKQVILIKYLNN